MADTRIGRPSLFDTALVVALSLTVFGQRLDYVLWQEKALPVPDITFVVVALMVLARAVALERTDARLLTRPHRTEVILVGFLCVAAAMSVAAAMVAATNMTVTAAPDGTILEFRAHPAQSVKTFAHLAFLVVVALVLGRILTLPLLRRVLVTFFLASIATGVIAIVQALDQNLIEIGFADALGLVSRTSGDFVRPVSIFSEPAYLGYFSLIGAVVGLGLYSLKANRWIVPGIAVCVVALLLAASAGPIVASIPVLIYVVWRAAPSLKRLWPSLAVMTVVGSAVLVLAPAGSTLVDRAGAILSGSDASASLRQAMNEAAITIWQLSPATGVGLGNTRYYMPDLIHLPFLPDASYGFQESNAYLGMLAECGVLGLVALAAFVIALLLPVSRVRRELDWITTAPILMFGVAFLFIGGLISPMFWFWVGVRLAVTNQARSLARIDTARA